MSDSVFNVSLLLIGAAILLLIIFIALYMSRSDRGDRQYPNRLTTGGKGLEGDEWRPVARNPLYTVQPGEEPGMRLVEQSAPAQRKGGSSEPVSSGAASGGGGSDGGGEGGGGEAGGGEGGGGASPA